MARKKRRFEDIEFQQVSLKGQSLSAPLENGKQIRVDGNLLIPGDAADLTELRKRKGFIDARPLRLVRRSPDRVTPWCPHFGICGGCTWQHADYPAQLRYKDEILRKALSDHQDIPEPMAPTLPSPRQIRYRNKLEYSFSRRRWFEDSNAGSDPRALGFFVPKQNNRVVDIYECYHQDSVSDRIRNRVREYALEKDISFHDPIEHQGLLRTLVIRITSTGQIMVALVLYEEDKTVIDGFVTMLQSEFPEITSLYYIVNNKMNDAYGDCPATHAGGETAVYEQLGHVRFRIGPLSFFQVNPLQTVALYELIRDFADLDSSETLYDLYTGTGSIALFLAERVKNLVAVEYVESAIEDARINAELNGIKNAEFFAGDMKDVLNDEFIARNGRPDVLICDPPRAGLHPDVVETIIASGASRLVYVSCNPVSLGRDLLRLRESYRIVKYRAVDMSPQTPHVETVMLLEKKREA
ncbi:23S rRNA (uracil(1939)-C(5))-methyltransferase RlmD [Salinispira pacifica]|uniref:RNA methyltransferase, TrmA family n=1 Tax=Salinispira pacifica TaxID=1307761 RepID=V5WDV5_9SPIO|nr:23S rRNA (uracil(1939)-C(5))-methyltransferase RlmD [Salinispira pacifica]AHC13749.1 RNA methyltransferase, TrmA family [Salinispira pacifica]